MANPMGRLEAAAELSILFEEWEDEGLLPDNGLCCSITYNVDKGIGLLFISLMQPEPPFHGHWGIDECDLCLSEFERNYAFTDLRKNLLLLFIEYLKNG